MLRSGHLATAGVSANVSGTLIGSKALVQMKAKATLEPPLASQPVMAPCLSGSPLSLTS